MPAVALYADTSAAIAAVHGGDSPLPAPGFFPGVPLTTNDTANCNKNWSPDLSASVYRVDKWGPPYFKVNSFGNMTILPFGESTLPHQEIDLLKVVKKISDPKNSGSGSGLGLQLPVVIRFPDVLKHRLESLQGSFENAIRTLSYGSHYQGVYPVKCNQDRFIVEDIVKFGSGFRFGLEAGSKPELLLAMSCLTKGNPEAFLVCNGFKDAEYISLAILARKLCLNTVIVLEQEEEVDLVIELSRRMNLRPIVGVRAKLRTKHSGHFGSTSGEKGKFGLTTTQILRVVRKLSDAGMIDCLQLLHFHIGSQIPSTALLRGGVSEGAQIYCELTRLGAAMRVIDIGGGLGIDYDGSKSDESDISVSYTLEEYALAVVGAVQAVCDRKGVKNPVICSESGRAIVSHHSVLVFEAFSSSVSTPPTPAWMSTLALDYLVESLTDEARVEYRALTGAAMKRDYENCLFHTEKLKEKCVDQFKDGSLGMEQLSAVDGLCELVTSALGVADGTSTYNVNLSVFTSIPDFWGIGQLFPIVPIHRLEQQPRNRAILSDLTCDSDGKIDKFIGGESSLPLHDLGSGVGESGGYYLGMFLGGAYEEGLGGIHNLFGGPSVVRVQQCDGPQSFAVTRAVPGPSCSDVLRVMQHEPELMFQALKHRAEECLHSEDGDYNVASIGNGLARSFNNMPYLVPEPAATSTCGFVDGATPCEDEQWSFVCA